MNPHQQSAGIQVLKKLVLSILISGVSIGPLMASFSNPQSSQPTAAAQSSPAPLALDEVVRLIKQSKKDPHQVVSTLAERGVGFELDEKTGKKLQKAGADDGLLYEIWKVTPNGRAHIQALLTSPTGAELQASHSEALSFHSIQDQAEPDGRLRMVDEFEKKFPASQLLPYVYTVAAKAHQQKGEFDQAVQYGRKSLKLNPDNPFSLVVVALALPEPAMLRGSPNEVKERLLEAQTDASRALTLLDKLSRQATETDDQFQERKGSVASDAHLALGMVEMQREDFEKALAEYKAAISSTTKPTFQNYYRLAEAYASIGQVPQAIETLQKASELARGTPLQKYADDFISELQRKSH
jgi:tetratricopeptide (TPR) repeat protein